MLRRVLKPLRVAVAIAFVLPTAFLFLDLREWGASSFAGWILHLQFVPSLLSALAGASLATAGCMAVLVLTLIFGRLYCSTICPLGTLQDAIHRLSDARWLRRGQKRRRHSFSKPQNTLRYTILALTVLLFTAGSGLLLNFLDPFSNFGRMLTNLARPALIAINNLTAPLAEQWGIHALYRIRWPQIEPVAFALAAAMLLLVGWLGARHGRLYCNSLCPVGTLLGLVSRLSIFRVRLHQEACKACGLCERVCKAGCIDIGTMNLDSSRCVACYNCLSACPHEALQFTSGKRGLQLRPTSSKDRRKLLLALGTGLLGLVTARPGATQQAQDAPSSPIVIPSRPTSIPEKRTSPVSPPGSGGIELFTSRCTACHLCVSACPSSVLVPSVLDFGPSGLMQPRMSFSAAHCNYDCTLCSQVCPSGAIQPLPRKRKQRTQVGVAKFIKDNCVVATDNTNCGACSEHCPTKAVHMVPYPNTSGRPLVIPEVNEALCVGCGGCEHACPTRPYRAIYVDGNPIHKQAEKPVVRPLESLPEAPGDDFPF